MPCTGHWCPLTRWDGTRRWSLGGGGDEVSRAQPSGAASGPLEEQGESRCALPSEDAEFRPPPGGGLPPAASAGTRTHSASRLRPAGGGPPRGPHWNAGAPPRDAAALRAPPPPSLSPAVSVPLSSADRGHLLQCHLHLRGPYFQTRSQSEILGLRTAAHLLEETQCNPQVPSKPFGGSSLLRK